MSTATPADTSTDAIDCAEHHDGVVDTLLGLIDVLREAVRPAAAPDNQRSER